MRPAAPSRWCWTKLSSSRRGDWNPGRSPFHVGGRAGADGPPRAPADEIVPLGSSSDVRPSEVDPLRYQTEPASREPGSGDELAFVKVRYKKPAETKSRLTDRPVRYSTSETPSVDFHFAAAIAGFGMLLRQSEHRGTITTEDVLSLARAGLGQDTHGDRQGFLELVEAYSRLVRTTAAEESR